MEEKYIKKDLVKSLGIIVFFIVLMFVLFVIDKNTQIFRVLIDKIL